MDNPLQAFLDVLVHRWRVVLLMTVLATLAAALLSLTQRPTYEATAVIALSPATLSVPPSNQSPPYYLMVDSPRRLPIAFTPAYYVALLKSVPAGAAADAAITISPNASDRSLIELTAQSSSARAAVEAANALARAGVDRIQQAILPVEDEVAVAYKNLEAAELALAQFAHDNGLEDYDLVRLPNPPLPEDKQLELGRLWRARDTAEAVYQEFARDQARAAILAATAYRPTTIPAREPTAPVSPKPPRDILMGGVLGLLLGLLSAFALEYSAGKIGERQTTARGIAGNRV